MRARPSGFSRRRGLPSWRSIVLETNGRARRSPARNFFPIYFLWILSWGGSGCMNGARLVKVSEHYLKVVNIEDFDRRFAAVTW